MRRYVVALLASFAALCTPAYAADPTPPAPATAPATNIGPLGATLNGTVTPNGHATNIHFQYGTTTNYGKNTLAQAVGQGTTPVPVAASLAGLKSNTTYHFRLVATSSAGTKRSGDRTFKTLKPSTALAFSPNPPVYGRPVTISGQLVGTGAAGATVTLLGRPFPFSAPFVQVGNAVISATDGTYAFSFPSATATSQFEVKATTSPATTSAIATMNVASLISFHVHSHARKGSLLRMSGSVLPAQDGLLVKIQKRSRSGTFHTVAHTTLSHGTATRSTYSRRLRIQRTGTYRTLVQSAGGTISPGTRNAVRIDVTR
jgi:hypothetical protein